MVFIIFPHTIPESYHRKSVPIASKKYPGTILEKNVSMISVYYVYVIKTLVSSSTIRYRFQLKLQK